MTKSSRWWLLGLLTVLLAGGGVFAQQTLKRMHRKARLEALHLGPTGRFEGLLLREPEDGEGMEGEEEMEQGADEPLLRRNANRAAFGHPSPEGAAHLAQVADQERRRWAHLMPGHIPLGAPVAGEAWVNLGPTDAAFQFSGARYLQVDSGRISKVVVDPRDPDTVYLSTSGGGLWKTTNFSAPQGPTWRPISDTLGNMAVGALAIDPQSPDTLYLGTGDFMDGHGNAIHKSTNGGGLWSAPLILSGTYPTSAGGLPAIASSIRDIKVDPAASLIVLAASDVGLFRSTNAGASFALVDLPNAGTQLPEATWSLAHVGTGPSGSHWVITGQGSCDSTSLPPIACSATVAGGISYRYDPPRRCAQGNQGDVWRSTDSGATWTSLRASAALPSPNGGLGRIIVAAGTPSGPATTVLYASVGGLDEIGDAPHNDLWRSTDGGRIWTSVKGSLSNPTTDNYCTSSLVAQGQPCYDQAIAVDPTNNARVYVGGSLCSVRTTNGLAQSPIWDNASYWMPHSGLGQTSAGLLRYVHADFHAMAFVEVNGTLRILVGTDGGLFTATTLFTASPPAIDWRHVNKGLVSHLCYSVGSGDPADGNQHTVITGMQDNGTRFRHYTRWRAGQAWSAGAVAGPRVGNGLQYRTQSGGTSGGAEPSWPTAPGSFVQDGTVRWDLVGPVDGTTFNQVYGGDGVGAAVNMGTQGEWIWGSQQYARKYCRPELRNCNDGATWTDADPSPLSPDRDAFLVRFSPIQTDPSGAGFLTNTIMAVWKSSWNGSSVQWTRLFPSVYPPSNFLLINNVFASQSIPQLYAAILSEGKVAVTSNETTWTVSSQLGVGPLSSQRLRGASSVAFPTVTPAGSSPGDVYLASSGASMTEDNRVVSPAVGHLFRTTNRGTTWTAFHGNGTEDLPNVPIRVVRYDPGDSSNNTIYVGTELGLYRTKDGGNTWHRFGVGLPLVSVTDMYIAKNQALLRIATYGRGLWEIHPAANTAGVLGDGDYDRDQQLDFVDLAAMSSRLGASTQTAGWPTYTWYLDLVPNGPAPSALDEADLAAQLSRFGGRP